MHCYNYLCADFTIVLNTEPSTYIIDSTRILQANEDSVLNRHLSFEKDTSLYFSKDKLSVFLGKDADNQTGKAGEKRPFTLEGDDGIFALLLVCFLFFTRIYRGGFSFFEENLSFLFSFRKNKNLFNETTSTEFWFNFILVFQSILLASIVMFDFFLEFEEHPVPKHSFFTILLFIFSISFFLFLKYIFYIVIGYLFDIKEAIHIWIRNYIIILEMMGIIAFIPALMLVYSQNVHYFLLIFFIILFIASRLLLFYRLITFFLKQHVNFLFLIAYLCSVEIIPYTILYQVLIYIYKVDIISLLWH